MTGKLIIFIPKLVFFIIIHLICKQIGPTLEGSKGIQVILTAPFSKQYVQTVLQK